MLQEYGLQESSEIREYEDRVFLDVLIYLVYASGSEKTHLLETLNEKCTTQIFYKTKAKRMVSWQNIYCLYSSYASKRHESKEPVFFLAVNSKDFNSEKCFRKLGVNDPRFHFLILLNECMPKQDLSLSQDERAVSLHFVSDKNVLSTINNMLEEYSFQTVRCKTKYLHYLLDLQRVARQPHARSKVKLDLVGVGLVAMTKELDIQGKCLYMSTLLKLLSTCI